MEPTPIFAGLNPEQARAVAAVRGPVCILAGAGSGKTTTITRRIAHQVATGAFAPSSILAVTFTDKAAGEMKRRLAALGVTGVLAKTFHAAAFAQLRALASDPPREVLPSKVLLLRAIANMLPGAYRFRPAADLATEIEWSKNRRIGPAAYRASLDGREPPIPADLMSRVYAEYERRKAALDRVDFEDLLELAIRMYETDETALRRFRDRYLAFTVDEYQDVNLLQQSLLEHWLGDRDEICVVGDDYQSIYAFTGATPAHLLGMPGRYPDATVVKLEANYRSTPEVLSLANQLVPELGGVAKVLRPVHASGPKPVLEPCVDREDEARLLLGRLRALCADGLPLEEAAVLLRTNARAEDYGEALRAAGIPFRVRGGAFLARQAARRLLPRLERSTSVAVARDVREAAVADGLLEHPGDGLGEAERNRQADLVRLVDVAEELDDGLRTVAEFVAEVRSRFADGDGPGVNLLTYHRAKGLEFEAVFLPCLEANELPSRQARSPAARAEERRLLYVGLTRAKRHLFVTWAGRPSPFLAELGVRRRPPAAGRERAEDLPPVFHALKSWRLERARSDGIPAYVVFHDSTLAELARRSPRTRGELASVHGVGPGKLERYGADVLRVLAESA